MALSRVVPPRFAAWPGRWISTAVGFFVIVFGGLAVFTPRALGEVGASAPGRPGKLLPVTVGAFEAFLGVDAGVPRSRVRGYEAALDYALGQATPAAAKCGYEMKLERGDYDGANPMAPAAAMQMLESKGAWIALGPLQAKHLQLAARAAGLTPLVSPLASVSIVDGAGENVFAMGAEPRLGMPALVKALKEQGYGKKYGALHPATCVTCRSFVQAFSAEAVGQGLVESFSKSVALENPSVDDLVELLKGETYDFLVAPVPEGLLLPLLESLKGSASPVRLVGSDAWGSPEQFSLKGRAKPTLLEGLVLREGGDVSSNLKFLGLPMGTLGGGADVASPTLHDISIVRFFGKVVERLCEERPKSREDFLAKSAKWPRTEFLLGLPPSLFQLQAHSLAFLSVAPAPSTAAAAAKPAETTSPAPAAPSSSATTLSPAPAPAPRKAKPPS